MNEREMKIAKSIKRQKKTGKLISGSINVDSKKIGQTRKSKISGGHKYEGGIHHQNGGPHNEYSK